MADGSSALILKKVTLSSASPGFSGESDLSLAILELESTGYGWSGESDLTLPSITLDSGGSNYVGSSTLTLLPVTLSSEGNMTTGHSTLTLKKVQLSSYGYTAGYGTSAFDLPIVTLSSYGGIIGTGNSDIELLPITIESSSDTGVTYLCLVLHNEREITNYDWTFDSFAEFDGNIYAANSTGLYILGGDTDNGTFISSEIETGLVDMGASQLKMAFGHYLGYRSDGKLQMKLVSDDQDGTYLELPDTNDKIRTHRILTELGIRGRWLGANIKNIYGADFTIVSLGMLAKILSRRIGND